MNGVDLLAHRKSGASLGAALPAAPRRRAILVAGMSRSGTSLMTHILHVMGVALPHDLVGAGRGNPLGHHEPQALVKINAEFLARLGRQWDDPRPLPDHSLRSSMANEFVSRIIVAINDDYGDAPLLAIKDPRLCRLLPLYLRALDALKIQPLVVLQVRPAAEVARSLADRDGLPPALSKLLWLRSVTEAEWHSRNCPRVWVSFAQIAGDWRDTVDRIGRELCLTWPADLDQAGQRIIPILQPDRPLDAAWADWMPRPEGLLTLAWNAVADGLACYEPAARAGFDSVRAALAQTDLMYVPALDALLQRREAEFAAIQASTCWRLTRPLRILKHWANANWTRRTDDTDSASGPARAAFQRLPGQPPGQSLHSGYESGSTFLGNQAPGGHDHRRVGIPVRRLRPVLPAQIAR